MQPRKVNWAIALILSFFFGGLGVDRFYMGKIGTGILKLITFGGFGIWWLIDLILIAAHYQFKGIVWTSGGDCCNADKNEAKSSGGCCDAGKNETHPS